jgi:serine protease Do
MTMHMKGVLALGAFTLLAIGLVASVGVNAQDQKQKAYLGIAVEPVAGERGIVIREVSPNAPAAKGGLKVGDRIVKFADKDIDDVKRFLADVAAKKPGDKLTLRIQRAGKEQDINVTIGEWPREKQIIQTRGRDDPAGAPRPAYLGVQTQALTADARKRLNLNVDSGIHVVEIVPNSPAAKAGLMPDDVITAFNGQSMREPAQLREAVQQTGAGKEVSLQVVRGKEKLTLKTTLQEGAFGQFLTPGDDRFPMLDVESMFETNRRVRELERRVNDLEKRLRALEKK